MKRLPFLLLLLSAPYVLGAPSLVRDVYKFGCEGIIWDAQGWAEWIIEDNSTVQWDHQLPLPNGMDMSDVLSASLTIEGIGIDNIFGDLDGDGSCEGLDEVSVYLNDQLLGSLEGDSTTFSLDRTLLTDPMLALAQIEFRYDQKISDMLWPVDTVRLTHSILSLTLDDSIASATIVPAPSAILLCGIGTMLAGYLKNRS